MEDGKVWAGSCERGLLGTVSLNVATYWYIVTELSKVV